MKVSSAHRILLLFVAFPLCAYANAGTPLMWAGMLHLFFGNALIGWFEGGILSVVFKVKPVKTIVLMVLANYFSAWVGFVVIGAFVGDRIQVDLYSAPLYVGLMAAGAFAVTILLEFPFVAFAMRGQSAWVRKSVFGSLLVQTVSYLALAIWYSSASHLTLYTQNTVVPASAISMPADVVVYFIGDDDGDVYELSLRTLAQEKAMDLESNATQDRLFMRPSGREDTWDLMALIEDVEQSSAKQEVVTQELSVTAVSTEFTDREPAFEPNTWQNYAYVPKLGAAEDSAWEFHVGHWAGQGMSGTNKLNGSEVNVACESVFGEWQIRNAMHLPSDKVLFQLGTNQICIFDPVRHEVALLAKGRGPIAVIENKNE